ncbi:MAG TPA: glycogen/starch synthase [Ktedonobacterales bacterium]
MSHLIPSGQQRVPLDRIPMASSLPLTGPAPRLAAASEPLTSPPLDVEAALRGARLRVLILAAECAPYVKSGGVADVVDALARALRRMGHDVRVALPRYGAIDREQWGLRPVVTDMRVPVGDGETHVTALEAIQPDGGHVYFIDAPAAFSRENGTIGYPDDGERFILFNRAALELTRALDWAPDIVHCHDWYASITPNLLKTTYRDDPRLHSAASVLTIHNLQYHGIFGYRILEVAGIEQQPYLQPEDSQPDAVDLLGRGIEYADVVSTVSPRYAAEILTEEYGEGLHRLLRARRDRLYGILNGIDVEQFDPSSSPAVETRFDAFSIERRAANKRGLQRRFSLPLDERAPLIAIISRFNAVKGFELLDLTFTPILEQGAQIIAQGVGEPRYEKMMQRLSARYPRQFNFQRTFSVDLSQRILAGADMLLMPSLVEPCGVTQMQAMRFGCIPIVHRVGGLADTVREFDPAGDGGAGAGNGFTFSAWSPFHLFAAVTRALEAYRFRPQWEDLMQRAMLADHSWDASAEQYVALYRRAVELRRLAAVRAG